MVAELQRRTIYGRVVKAVWKDGFNKWVREDKYGCVPPVVTGTITAYYDNAELFNDYVLKGDDAATITVGGKTMQLPASDAIAFMDVLQKIEELLGESECK